MAVAGLDSLTVQIAFSGSSFTDVSAYVRLGSGISGTFGRASQFDDVAAGTLRLQLRNEDGRFTPDNPLSPYFPNIVLSKQIRVRAIRGGVTYQVFRGYIMSWEPTFPTADSTSGAVVEVSCVDTLARMDQTILGSLYVEQLLSVERDVYADLFPLDDPVGSIKLRNAGQAEPPLFPTLGTAVIVASSTKRGNVELVTGSDCPFGLPGYLSLRPSGTAGSVVKVSPQTLLLTASGFAMWVRFPVSTLPAPGIPLTVMQSWETTTVIGASLILKNVAGSVDLQLLDYTGAVAGTVATGVNDNAWHFLAVDQGSTGQNVTVYFDDLVTAVISDVTVYSTAGAKFANGAYIGGATAPLTPGKNTSCTTMDVAGITFTWDRGAAVQAVAGMDTTVPVYEIARYFTVIGYVPWLSTATANGTPAVRNVIATDTTGRSLLDVAQEVARTAGGVLFQTPDGTLHLYLSDAAHSVTPVATIDVELDVDAQASPPAWQQAVDNTPTRATVTTPSGSVTVIDTTAESSTTIGGRREIQISSCAASDTDATSLGWAALRVGKGLRLANFSVDLVTAGTNLWASMLTLGALRPGVRLRVTNLPTATFGVSYVDVEVQGWGLSIGPDHFTLTFDTVPADTPVRGKVGAGEYAKAGAGTYSTGTSGTAVGVTATGTLVVTTTASGVPLTVDPTAYPLDLSWNGERVTVTSAPASSTSPQTVTITARGVAPTQARAHIAGESVNIWHAAQAAL